MVARFRTFPSQPVPTPHPVPRILAALAPAAICLASDRLGAAFPTVLALTVSLLILVFPPRPVRPRWLEWTWLALALVPLLGFLPLDPAAMPAWRTALARDTGLDLGRMITPQPWALFAALVPYWSGLGWLWWVCAQHWDAFEGVVLARTFLVLLAGIAAAVVWKLAQTAALSGVLSGDRPALATRNQLATLLAAGVAVGTAIVFARAKLPARLFGGASALLGIAALALLGSRGGCLVAGAGVAVVLGTIAALRRSFRHAIAAVVLIAAGIAAFAILPGETGRRLRASVSGELRDDFRFAVQRDADGLIADGGLTGFGLGNFDGVFPFYRQESRGDFRAVHPENDLLWFAGEAGLLAAALALATVAGMGCGWWRHARSSAERLETAAAAAGVTAVIVAHGLLDVPAHSPLVWFVLAGIAGAAFGVDAAPSRRAGAWMPAGALAACAIAAAMILQTDRPRPFAADTSLDEIPHEDRIDRWLAQHPLDWQIVELRAHRLAADGRIDEAREEFTLLERLTPFQIATAERALYAWDRARRPHEIAVATLRLLERLPPASRPPRLAIIADRARHAPALAQAFASLDPPLAWEIRRLDIPEPDCARTLALLAAALAHHRDFPGACRIVFFQLAPALGESPPQAPPILPRPRAAFPEIQKNEPQAPDSWYEVAGMRFLSGDAEGSWRVLQTLLAVKLQTAQP